MMYSGQMLSPGKMPHAWLNKIYFTDFPML